MLDLSLWIYFTKSQKRPALPRQSWWFESRISWQALSQCKPQTCFAFLLRKDRIHSVIALPISAWQAQWSTHPGGPWQNSKPSKKKKKGTPCHLATWPHSQSNRWKNTFLVHYFYTQKIEHFSCLPGNTFFAVIAAVQRFDTWLTFKLTEL